VQAFAHALLQVMKQETNGSSASKKDACHNCGETGHFRRDCPKASKGGGFKGTSKHNKKGNGQRQQHQRQRGAKGRRTNDVWKTQAPGPSDPKEKTVSGKTFHWCAKCNRWTTSHTTATHVVRGGAANMVPAFDNFAWHTPVNVADLFGAADPASTPIAKSSASSIPQAGYELLRLVGWFAFGIGCTLGVFTTFLNFAWWKDATLAGLSWVAQHYAQVVPLVLWLGLLTVGMSLPWMLLPSPLPTDTPTLSATPPKAPRRTHRQHTKLVHRLQKHARPRPCGASRLGFHRSFPLRCRNENLHMQLKRTPARRWLDASNLNHLADAVHRFATQFYPSAGCREGDQGKAKPTSKREQNPSAKPPEGKWVWSQNERGEWVEHPKAAKPWRQNASGEWIRFDRKDPLEHPIHQASTKPPKQRFLTKKAKKNFGRLLQDALDRRRQPDPEPPKPKRHPLVASIKRAASLKVKPSDADLHVTKDHLDAFDEIFGTPKYFAFITQEDLSAEVKKICTRIHDEYLSGKGRPPTRKESQLPVIWDSGASVCVSFDRNDFVGPIQPLANPSRLRGFFRNGPRIRGVGHVAWSFENTNDNLRTLKLPAMYVPEVKQRLLSTTCLLQAYPNESLTVLQVGMWLSGDGDKLGAIEVLTDSVTNLPTAYAYSYAGGRPNNPDGYSFAAPIPVASTINANLSDAQRELVRWHQKFGHASYRRVQFLMRSGILAHTEATRRLHAAAAKLRPEGCPLCAACQFGKQRCRRTPGKASSVVREVAGAFRRDDLFPGQRISVDHFICSTRGRLLNTRGKESEKEKYTGGCIFVDHASGFVHVELQVFLTAAETLKAKQKFEQLCRDYGVIPQSYQADNGTAFTSAAFTQHLADRNQTIRFAGTGAHHHNGIAERAIQPVMSRARTMLLHAALHWPDATNTQLWPFAVRQAVHLHNIHLHIFVPDPSNGLSPNDLFTKTKHPAQRFFDLHPLFCPAYALDKAIADGHKLPRWTPRSERYIFVGFSNKHASTIPLLLNPRTGAIVTNYHVVFDDWFTTVSSDPSRLPDFNTDEWEKLFGDSAFQFVLDESDAELLALAEEDAADAATAVSHATRSANVKSAMRQAEPPSPLPAGGPTRPMVAVEILRHAQEGQLELQREVLPEQQRESLPTVETHQQRESLPTVETHQQREVLRTTPP
jgi:Zinc knuckle/GAG-pre-integrase domain